MRKKLLLLLLLAMGLFLLTSCDDDPTEPTNNVVVEYSENAVKLTDETNNLITNFDANTGIINFSNENSQVSTLTVNDVIVAGPSTNAPYGLLRKVISIDGTTVTTVQATLEEAFEDLRFSFEKELELEDLESAPRCAEGVTFNQTRSDDDFSYTINKVLYEEGSEKIEVTGSIIIEPSFYFEVDISMMSIQKLVFKSTSEVTSSLAINCSKEFYNINQNIEIARMPFAPIVVNGVVLYPILTVDVGGNVSVSASVEVSAKQVTELTAGMKYENGNWSDISSINATFPEHLNPDVQVNVSAKAYTGPQLNLLLYGVAGPYIDANLFVEGTVSLTENPWWKLEGGLECGAGVKVEVLSQTIIDYYKEDIVEFSTIIDQADDTPQGTLTGHVIDAATQEGLANVNVLVKKNNETIEQGTTNNDGAFEFSVSAATGYVVVFSKDGYQSVEYQNVNVAAFTNTSLEPVMQIDETHTGNGTINGKIFDAFTGNPVMGVIVKLREGINTQEGNYIDIPAVSTNDAGEYTIENLPAGNYTAEASKAGYANSFFTVYCLGNETVSDQNGTITPELAENEIRIILTWGQTPSDLDSHLYGPVPESSNRFHTWYSNKNFYHADSLYANLDLDDTSSYGPETTTIYTQTDGVYTFSVHDYSNRNSSNSVAMSNSGAQVRVYFGSTLTNTFSVPANTGGTLWTVFQINGTVVTPINTMTYANAGRNSEFKNMPPK